MTVKISAEKGFEIMTLTGNIEGRRNKEKTASKLLNMLAQMNN